MFFIIIFRAIFCCTDILVCFSYVFELLLLCAFCYVLFVICCLLVLFICIFSFSFSCVFFVFDMFFLCFRVAFFAFSRLPRQVADECEPGRGGPRPGGGEGAAPSAPPPGGAWEPQAAPVRRQTSRQSCLFVS